MRVSSNRLIWYRISRFIFMDLNSCFFEWCKFSMANREKNVFFKKLATNPSLALLLGPRGMCEYIIEEKVKKKKGS